ncbi:MAG: hypothetical protein ACI3X6_02015, partial [Alloprevotella sp.]
NGQPISGQDKPFIREWFGAQTVQRYLFNIQIDNCQAEGLKGFSGKKMRIGRGIFVLFFA